MTLSRCRSLPGVAYAPSQKALGNWSATPESKPDDKEDNLYLWTDLSSRIPGTPLTVMAHLGYSDGNPGLGPNGTSRADSIYLLPNFSSTKDGSSIADGKACSR